MQEHILYFEHDIDVAKSSIELLEQEGYRVIHFPALPQGRLDTLLEVAKIPPLLVLMDIGEEADHYFDVCQSFKQDSFFAHVPIICISGLVGEAHTLNAYEAGAHDYLTKPVSFKTLSAKCDAIRQFHRHTQALKEQVSMSDTLAFDAMTASSELGEIIRFHEKISKINDYNELGCALVKKITDFGVSSSVMFVDSDNKQMYCSDDGNEYELEKSVFEMLKRRGRIYSWDHRALFNYTHFSVLVRAMPIDDEKRAGNLRDLLCLLLDGVESRVFGIENERQLEKNQDNIRLIAHTIGKMVVDLQANTLSMSEQFDKIVHELEDDVTEDFAGLNLLQKEEQVVMDHIHKATGQALGIFDQARLKDINYTKVLIELLEQLPE